MADAAESPNATTSSAAHRPRRLSLRKSLNECGLPPGYLDALEVKRRALDESIHKFIASKEREYKQYEKELKHQARREEHAESLQPQQSESPSPQPTVAAGRDHDATERAQDDTRKQPKQDEQAKGRQHKQREEDLLGVFTPDYLSLLKHEDEERSTSEPADVRPSHGDGPRIDVAASSAIALTRSHSDPAPPREAVRPDRLLLNHRTSSSGSSSIDGRLVSAMKSLNESSSILAPLPKRKRVSIAVGDSIVAPSDNVPVSLHVNSSSSHSRSRAQHKQDSAASRNRSAVLVATEQPPAHARYNGIHGAEAISTTAGAAAVAAAATSRQGGAADLSDTLPTQLEDDDMGDLFDIDDADMMTMHASHTVQPGEEAGSPQDSSDDIIGGRVHSATRYALVGADAADHVEQLLSPPKRPAGGGESDELHDIPLTPVIGLGASVQPADSGFRRPSVMSDPVYQGAQTSALHADEDVYSSSFSRPTSKGSFTSGSLGESYMARNAEAMLGLRARQQQQQQQRQPEQEQSDVRHRSSHRGTVLPVR